jgi:predicted nucleic acid-binding Zn ribbon protein
MTTTKTCIYCGSEIPAHAKICSVCKYDQRRWRNNLIFLGGLGGLLTIIISALTFTLDRATQTYKNLVWQDRINLIDFRWIDWSPHIVFANNGDGPIFISDILLQTKRRDRAIRKINRLVTPNEIIVVEPKGEELIWKQNPRWVGNESGIPSHEILDDSDHFKHDGFGNRFCFTRGYFNEDSSAVAMVRQHYGESGIKIVSENAALYVSYVSSHSRKRIKEEFQIIAAYFKSPASECASKASAAKDE